MALSGWTLPDRGALFVISGPSGVGKSTLIQAAIEELPGLAFSVSATTRAPREGEQDGVDYHFLSREAFARDIETGAFLEHAEVYGHHYGTPSGSTRAALDAGRSLILDIDVQGSRQVRGAMPESVHLMVVPPDLATLRHRLERRGTESERAVARRMAEAAEQLGAIDEYQYVVVNDDLDTARRVFQGILLGELSRVARRQGVVRSIQRALRHRQDG